MDPLDGIPERVLGFNVKSRWQISLNYLLPCAIELLVYVSLMTIDSAIVYQHLIDRHSLYAWLTLGLIFVPSVITFVCVLVSDQWPIETGCGSEKWKFFARQLVNLLLFPFCAVYRWVIECWFSFHKNFNIWYKFWGFRGKSFGALNRCFMIKTLMRGTRL